MSKNPLNLLLRFIQEIIGLVVMGYWGFYTFEGFIAYVTGIGIPILMATIWGVFAVAGDPSRSGKTVIDTLGPIRLLIELIFFTGATLAFYLTNQTNYALIYGSSVVLHYILSYDRIYWLFTKK